MGATPATYEVNGKQYVVIAAGGGKMGTKSGDAYVAFALPDRLGAAAAGDTPGPLPVHLAISHPS